MSTITKERVTGIARGEKCYTHDDVVELARIALASLEAEAVAFVMADDLKDSSIISTPAYRDLGEAMERTVGDVVALYAIHPAPVSVPDEMEPTVEAIKRILPTSNPDEYAACIGADMWNACRAAMLQGGEPATTAYKLPFEQWLSQQGERIEIDCGCVSVEVFMHWLRMAYGAGNSPAIPDGWVACSERMPHIGVPVITCCGDVVQYAAYAWDGKEWQDWYEEYDKLPASTFTHWHPRPAAPQQEVKS